MNRRLYKNTFLEVEVKLFWENGKILSQNSSNFDPSPLQHLQIPCSSLHYINTTLR